MAQQDLLVVNLLRLERGARQSPYSRVSRLFRRHPGIRWSRPYHSMIDDSVLALLQREPHWRITDCAIPALSHDGYRPELLQSGDKAARLRQAMEAELERHPGDPYACAKLGSLLVSEGELARGRALLRLGLENCTTEALAERYELLLHLAMAEAPHNPTQAEHLYREAMALPLQPRVTLAAALNLAGLLLERADGAAAADRERTLAQAADLCRTASAAAPELALGWASLGLVERRRGQLGAAIAAYQQALSLEPEQPDLHRNLAAAHLLAGDIGGARAGFRQAILLLDQQGQTAAAQALRQQVEPLVKLDG
jgi:tetratricopeptide (TPR) repeat protein